MYRPWRIAIAAAATLTLVVTAVWTGVLRSPPVPAAGSAAPGAAPDSSTAGPAELTLTPTQADTAGVDLTSTFRLKSAQPLTTEQVQKQLTVQPAVPVKVERLDGEGREFNVAPVRFLAANQVYRFRLAAAEGIRRDYQWSFQTKAPFRILGSLPRHQGTGVPVNTGVEVTFSHENYGDPEGFFTISPPVPGRFERHKKTVAFVPGEKLAHGTVYTVTVKQGLPLAGSSERLAADFTFSFETQPQDAGKGKQSLYFSMPTEPQEYATREAPFFQVSYHRPGGGGLPPVEVKAFGYRDASAYIAALRQDEQVPYWANYARSQSRVDTAALTPVLSFQGEVKTFDGYYATYLLFPQSLAPGYYLAEFRVEDQVRQVHFQVTDVSSYLAVSTTKTLVWLNDLASQAPISGARVAMGGATASTDGTGVATLPTPEQVAAPERPQTAYLTATTPDGREAVVEAGGGSHSYRYGPADGENTRLLYWKYLYLDRQLYRPDDTVNVWGVVRPREPGAAPVDKVTAMVIRNDYRQGDRPVTLAQATLPVRDGTFTGAVALPGLRPGNYEVQVRIGETILATRWFEVQTYTKPAYQLDVTPSKRAIFAHETVDFDLAARFFEGTPVPNLDLNYHLTWHAKDGERVTTDAAGRAKVSFTPATSVVTVNATEGWQTAWFYLNASLPEAGEITAQSTVAIFTSDIALDAGTRVEAGAVEISAQLNRVVLDRINSGQDDPWDWNYRGGPAAGHAVKGTIWADNWIREDDGEYYDFISKTVQKRYRWRPDPRQVDTFALTSDAAGRISYRFDIKKDQSYKVQLEVQDTRGNWIKRELWFYGHEYSPLRESSRYRYFHLDTAEAGKWEWGTDETATLVFKESNVPAPDRPWGYLFFTARLGLQDYMVQNQSTFRYNLKPTDPPNTTVRGVHFDGRMYREAYEYTLRFNPRERELQVQVTADKPEYRPQETVTLAVQVTDRQGRPVQAQVNLNLVDEALYALREQRVDLLGDLYRDYVPSGVVRTRRSHFMPEPGSGAEKGGEGGGVRKEFRDAVYFNTVTTDAAGRATATFKVPDNLTTWRVTWQALSSQMAAASGTVPVPVKLPFFVEMVTGETYLTGDLPVLSARAYGTALREGREVHFGVQVTGPDGKTTTSTAVGQAFLPVQIPLPRVQAGTWTVRVSAGAAGGLHDALERQFTAVDTYLRKQQLDFGLLQPDTALKGAEKGLTTLTFTDYERGAYLRMLGRLQWQWGNRLEQKLARTVAGDLMQRHFDGKRPWWWRGEELNTYAFQTPDGGVAILPYSDGELPLSALVADLAPERFDRAALGLFFERRLDDRDTDREHAVVALYGLAALDRPVLRTVAALLQEQDLTLPEQLYLALAAATLGDLEGVRPVYRRLLREQGETVGTALRLKAGRDQDEIMANTALAAVLAAKLNEPDAPALINYLAENQTQDALVLLEPLLAAKAALPRLGGDPVAFTYLLNGREERKELKGGQSFRLALSPADLANLRFRDIQGKVGVAAEYEAPLTEGGLKQAEGFAVGRAFAVVGRSGGEPQAGDLVKVTLTYSIPATAPGGTYELSDYLPSGLRLVERPWNFDVKERQYWLAWPMEVNGQKVTFWADRQSRPITYYARVVTPGEYTAEQPTLQHQRSGLIYGHAPREQVRIKW